MEEVPFDDRHVPLVEVDWERSAWWWSPLTRAIHPAVRMNSLVLGVLAILAIQAGFWCGEWLFAPRWQPSAMPPAELGAFSLRLPLFDWLAVVAESILSFEQFGGRELAFVTFELVWLTATLSLFGGVLARRSLVEMGQRTIAAWGESLALVLSRWAAFLWSMGMYLVGLFAMLFPFLLLGLLSRVGPIGAYISAALFLLFLPILFGVGRFALGAVVCFPLSVCAICAEKKADAFEGFSRSNAYLFQRPVAAVLCIVCLLAAGLVGEQIVYWSITAGWGLIRGTYLIAGGAGRSAANPDAFVLLGNWLASALVAAYWFSYFWSGSAATYLILRKAVDHTELDELDVIENPVERSLPDIPTTPDLSTAPAETASSDTASSDSASEN